MHAGLLKDIGKAGKSTRGISFGQSEEAPVGLCGVQSKVYRNLCGETTDATAVNRRKRPALSAFIPVFVELDGGRCSVFLQGIIFQLHAGFFQQVPGCGLGRVEFALQVLTMAKKLLFQFGTGIFENLPQSTEIGGGLLDGFIQLAAETQHCGTVFSTIGGVGFHKIPEHKIEFT